MYRLIIAGSRHINWLTPEALESIISNKIREVNLNEGLHIISGGAKGIDKLAYDYYQYLIYEKYNSFLDPPSIIYTEYEALWEEHGKAAGPIRNAQMAMNADGLLLIWDGVSKGSLSMKKEAEKKKLKIWELIIKFQEN